MSEMRSNLTGKVVDSYTNILTVKLFARARDEDEFVSEAIDEHTEAWRAQQRLGTWWTLSLTVMNAFLMVGTGALAILLWRGGYIAIGAVATAIPMAWQINNMSGFVAQHIANIFDDLGQVQDGMRSIAVERQMPDLPGAVEMPRITGAIRFDKVSFDYGRAARLGGVLHELDLDVAPGERIGLVGRSGAGKSTLVHLLLGFYRPETGRILIDGRDIAGLTQESLRAQIGMVTQDTSLLHRSIRDNIRYGRPEASEAESSPRRAAPTRSSSSRGWKIGTAAPASTPMSASAASSSRAASASASRSPASSSRTRRSWCSTRRLRRSIPKSRRRSRNSLPG